MSQSDFASSKMFYDTKNFPRGISRSGLFSRREVEILERHGSAMQALYDGSRKAETAAEKDFLKVLAGEKDASTEFEKTWLKYLKHTSQRRVSYTTGMAFAMADSSDYSDLDTD